MGWFTRWAFRRIVSKMIIGYIVFPGDGQSAYPGQILAPEDVEVVFK